MQRLLSLIEARSGSQLKDSRLTRVEAFIKAQEQAGLSPHKLEQALSEFDFSHPVWQALIQEITVGETYFFRNQRHFEALEHHVLPTIIKQRRRQRPYLRLWIAGCATGEEAYSIAMLLHDMIPDIADWSIFLLATDINLVFLEFARRGIYRSRAFRNETRPGIQARFFTETNDGYQVASHIRQMVTFAPLNLVDTVYPSLANNTTALDLILCRNVTIYFDRETTAGIVNRFYGALRPEGWLLVGHAEPQPQIYDAFTYHNLVKSVLYQKPPRTIEQPTALPPIPARQPVTRPAIPPAPPPASQLAPAPDIETLLAVAQQAADDEKWDDALDVLSEAELLNRFHPRVHYLRGLVYTHVDETHAAVQAFRQAVYCEPAFPMAHYALGELLLGLGQKQAAIDSWKRARKFLGGKPAEGIVLGADDLTTGMLLELVDYRLRQENADNHV